MAARLVTIGDSLTQGFQHGAIRRATLSYPAMVARVIGAPVFRQADFTGYGDGGPLLDIERLCRVLSREDHWRLRWWEVPGALCATRAFMARAERYWERGDGTRSTDSGPLHHNLAVWGFEVLDTLTLTDGLCDSHTPPPTDNLLNQVIEFGMYRTARRVLNPSQADGLTQLTQLGCAAAVSAEEGGIENLIVALGANNVLPTCVRLAIIPSVQADMTRLSHERKCTVWGKEHFEALYDRVVKQVKELAPQRVFLATVPHVTVAPVSRGVSPFAKKGRERVDGYYEFYTRFWIWDDDFETTDPHITRAEARAVDATIDAYNAHIHAMVGANPGWHVIDLGGLLDELAFRRSGGAPTYRFPRGLVSALRANPLTSFRVRPDDTVLLDTRFFRIAKVTPLDGRPSSEWQDAYRGGLFGLDGVHPTTIGYGLIADLVLRTMRCAGVPGADPERLPWDEIVAADSLVCSPPAILSSLQDTLRLLFGIAKLDRLISRVAGSGAHGL